MCIVRVVRLFLDMLVDKVRYMLVNIYAPNTDNVTFVQEIHSKVQFVGNNQIVIAGDFNLVLDSEKNSINRVSKIIIQPVLLMGG